ncbi:MAG: 50S ribosomal protein L30 [Nanoarchaeota archaeon]|nr:50S ribosomal protein L30 [Nanoarchaeota archaeon]
MLAVIRIRGMVGRSKKVNDTFQKLRLRKKHVCVVMQEKKELVGMVKKLKDFVAYGEIDKETLKLLIEKRGNYVGDKRVKEIDDVFVENLMNGKAKLQDKKIKPFFRLHPAKGGFGRYGLKKAYTEKGALGYRGKEINSLIKKML